jgi:hypothetical protein
LSKRAPGESSSGGISARRMLAAIELLVNRYIRVSGGVGRSVKGGGYM